MTTLHDDPILAWDNPPAVGPRGTLIVLPGRGESSSLYERFAARLAFDAYRVRVVSAPTVDEAVTLSQIETILADPALSGPFVLVGSDAGALYAAALVARRAVSVDALVLAGLPADGDVPPVAGEDELGERTSCPTHQARLAADNQLQRGAIDTPPPRSWLADAELGRIGIPVLGIHGAADAISPLALVAARYVAASNVELVSIADGRHDALNDATHRTVAATVVLFLERLRAGSDLAAIARSESLVPR